MAQFMTNIPRRMIYETMLIYEDVMLEMNILIYNQENFDKYIDKFNQEALEKLKSSFLEIKALIIMFVENKKYQNKEEFDKELNNLIKDEKLNQKIQEQDYVQEKLKKATIKVDDEVIPIKKVENLDDAKKYFTILDEFNSNIPKLLEQRRDEMK